MLLFAFVLLFSDSGLGFVDTFIYSSTLHWAFGQLGGPTLPRLYIDFFVLTNSQLHCSLVDTFFMFDTFFILVDTSLGVWATGLWATGRTFGQQGGLTLQPLFCAANRDGGLFAVVSGPEVMRLNALGGFAMAMDRRLPTLREGKSLWTAPRDAALHDDIQRQPGFSYTQVQLSPCVCYHFLPVSSLLCCASGACWVCGSVFAARWVCDGVVAALWVCGSVFAARCVCDGVSGARWLCDRVSGERWVCVFCVLARCPCVIRVSACWVCDLCVSALCVCQRATC